MSVITDNLVDIAQPGVLSDPTPFVEYLIFNIKDKPDAETVKTAMAMIKNIDKSIGQKDTTAGLSVTVGFSANAWPILFPDAPLPDKLHAFPAMENQGRRFPSTPGDIFFMIKSKRMDLNFQAAKYIGQTFRKFADLEEDIQAFKYLDDRDMIDFVDGTENPKGDLRAKSILVDNDLQYLGGSYLTFQIYIDRQDQWDAVPAEEQENIIGRTKWDDIEIDDDKKKPYAHNVKSKVYDEKGDEVKMFRQNRAFGNAKQHGTVFVGFAKTPEVIETSLKQMITADEDGYFDHLLKFVDATIGVNFFIPPQKFMNQFGG